MKTTLTFLFSFISLSIATAQSDTLWTRSIGGPGNEAAGTMNVNNLGNNMSGAAIDAVDGGIYICSYSPTAGGYITNNNGDDDIWVVKLNGSTGDTLWTKVIGGSGNDRAYKIRAVSTGGCIVAGKSNSSTGAFSTSHGQVDGFLARFDANGTILWSKCYGGTEQDYLYDVAENPAGNFVACGETNSSNGDLAGTGAGLAWVIYISGTNGSVSNSITVLGPSSASPDFLENFTIITRLEDGTGYLVSGFTSPNFNDFNLDDIWVAKVNFAGTLIWSKKYGSTNKRDGSAAIVDAGNGEFYIAGLLGGNGGFPNYFGGNGDGWLIKCNANGDTLFTKNYGGNDWDYFNDAFKDNAGNLYLAGFSRSADVMLASQPSFGLADYWVVKINANGDTLYTKRFGGSTFEAITSIAGTGTPDEFVVTGRSDSNDGWVWGANGGRDLWVVKFGQLATNDFTFDNKLSIQVMPNPSQNNFSLKMNSEVKTDAIISLYNNVGQLILSNKIILEKGTNFYPIPTENEASGIYYLIVNGPVNQHSIKLIKN